MKRLKLTGKALVACLIMSAMILSGCKSGKETEKTKKEKDAKKTAAEEIEDEDVDDTEAPETTTEEETEAPTTAEADPESAPENTIDPDSLYAKAEMYINAAYAYYDAMAGRHVKLYVFDSQLEETDEGYKFIVRSQEGNDANIYFSEVTVNTTTGEMSDDQGNVWNVSDYV